MGNDAERGCLRPWGEFDIAESPRSHFTQTGYLLNRANILGKPEWNRMFHGWDNKSTVALFSPRFSVFGDLQISPSIEEAALPTESRLFIAGVSAFAYFTTTTVRASSTPAVLRRQ